MQFKKLLAAGMLLAGSVFAITSCSGSFTGNKAASHSITGKIEKGDVLSATCTMQGVDESGAPQGGETAITFNPKNSTYSGSPASEAAAVVVSCKVKSFLEEQPSTTELKTAVNSDDEFVLTTVSKPDASTANVNVLTTMATDDAIAAVKEGDNVDVNTAMQDAVGKAYKTLTGETLPSSYDPATASLDNDELRNATVSVLVATKAGHKFDDIFANKVSDIKDLYTKGKADYSHFAEKGTSSGTDVDNSDVAKAPSIKFVQSTIGTEAITDSNIAIGDKDPKFNLSNEDTTNAPDDATYAITSNVKDAKPVSVTTGTETDVSALFKAGDAVTTFTVCMLPSNGKETDCTVDAKVDATKVLAIKTFTAQTGTAPLLTLTGTKPTQDALVAGDSNKAYTLTLPADYAGGVGFRVSVTGDTTDKKVVVSDGKTATVAAKLVSIDAAANVSIDEGIAPTLLTLVKQAVADTTKELYVCLLSSDPETGDDCKGNTADAITITIGTAGGGGSITPEAATLGALTASTTNPTPAGATMKGDASADTPVPYTIELPAGTTAAAADVTFDIAVTNPTGKSVIVSNGADADAVNVVAEAKTSITTIKDLLKAITVTNPVKLFICVLPTTGIKGSLCTANSGSTLTVSIVNALGDISDISPKADAGTSRLTVAAADKGYQISLPSTTKTPTATASALLNVSFKIAFKGDIADKSIVVSNGKSVEAHPAKKSTELTITIDSILSKVFICVLPANPVPTVKDCDERTGVPLTIGVIVPKGGQAVITEQPKPTVKPMTAEQISTQLDSLDQGKAPSIGLIRTQSVVGNSVVSAAGQVSAGTPYVITLKHGYDPTGTDKSVVLNFEVTHDVDMKHEDHGNSTGTKGVIISDGTALVTAPATIAEYWRVKTEDISMLLKGITAAKSKQLFICIVDKSPAPKWSDCTKDTAQAIPLTVSVAAAP